MAQEPSTLEYPNVTVQLTGEDSNAFNLIGLVSAAIREQHGDEAAAAFVHVAMDATSFDNLLVVIQSYVHVR